MQINLFEDKKLSENYLDIHYKEMDASVQGIIEYCEAFQLILGRNDQELKKLAPNELFYCEIVDRKCYAYMEKDVYQIDFSIQKLLELFSNNGFVRISKTMLVNIFKIDFLKTDLNMRVHITMENGERLIVNRTYKKDFFHQLYKMKKEKEHGSD